jgi:hypothetical protein
MKTLGVIFTGYNCREYLENSLASWVNLRERNHSAEKSPQIKICAVNVVFDKFDAAPEDGTRELLLRYQVDGKIDHAIIGPDGMTEVEARGTALKWLISQGADTIIQVDIDEFYTIEEINRILRFVDSQEFIVAFRLSLKNFVFDKNTYLEEAFTPMRIHRVKAGPFTAVDFCDDNNVLYRDDNGSIRDTNLATMTVPKKIAWIRHYTWLNDERSKKKIAYQNKRWPSCSFKWNEEENRLEFNLDYYRQNQLSFPKTETEFSSYISG